MLAKTFSRICGKIYKTNPSLRVTALSRLYLLIGSWLTDLAKRELS